MLETETIDKLFLELSQVTKAATAKELTLMKERDELLAEIEMWKATANAVIDFDAVRYRWLLDNTLPTALPRVSLSIMHQGQYIRLSGRELNVAIDARIARERGKHDFAIKMRARADADSLPAEHELRIKADAFDLATIGFYADDQTITVQEFIDAWTRARRCWCDYTGEKLELEGIGMLVQENN